MLSLTQKEDLKEGLNRLLITLAIFTFFFGSYIANFGTTEQEAWDMYLNILRFDYLLIILALRDSVKKLIKPLGYKVLVYLLINHFIDKYFGIKSWSWNDALTVVAIVLEYTFGKLKSKY